MFVSPSMTDPNKKGTTQKILSPKLKWYFIVTQRTEKINFSIIVSTSFSIRAGKKWKKTIVCALQGSFGQFSEGH